MVPGRAVLDIFHLHALPEKERNDNFLWNLMPYVHSIYYASTCTSTDDN